MYKILKRILLVFPVLTLSGCFMGTMRSAEPIGAGNMARIFYFNFPLYYSRDYRNNARNAGSCYWGANVGGMWLFGASDNMDFGLKLDLSEGMGPQLKFRFLHNPPLSMALNAGFGYHFFAEGFSWNMDFLMSSKLSPYSSLYLGFLLHHAPDYRNFSKWSDYFDVKIFRNFAGVALGITFKNFEGVGFIKSFNMELVLPVDKYPPLLWGFSVGF